MSINKVRGYLLPGPGSAGRECVLIVETLNLGTTDEALSPIIRMNYDIEDQADDFPDGEYVVNYGGPRLRRYVAFTKSGGRYREKKG